MKNRITIYSFCLGLLLMSCNSDKKEGVPVVTKDVRYKLVQAFPSLQFSMPVELVSPDDNSDRIFILEQKGTIQVFPNKADAPGSTTFLDINSRVVSGSEKGLLGLAFHPNYKTNGYFYVNYTRGNPLETVISRFKVSANSNIADPNSELILLRYSQPYENHNGGKLAFGNDGFLYIAVGDGGSGGDPQNNAQNKKVLLGKILRIDVNNASGSLSYSIPADNPFKGNSEGNREEIYAFGMRNPWRFNFDRTTNTLWAGDVGQDKIEEVDIIEKGGNYGWRITEGNECYNSATCSNTGLTEPIWTYKHDVGQSITGGYVCRDKNLTGLTGKYIYGDYVSGDIWALSYSGKTATKNELLTNISGGISSFGEDSKSNLYVLIYGTGKIYKFIPE